MLVAPPTVLSPLRVFSPIVLQAGVSVATTEQIEAAVNDYMIANPPSTTAIDAHLIDPTPHPVYDDIPSLTLLFENGLA